MSRFDDVLTVLTWSKHHFGFDRGTYYTTMASTVRAANDELPCHVTPDMMKAVLRYRQINLRPPLNKQQKAEKLKRDRESYIKKLESEVELLRQEQAKAVR